MCLFDVAVVYS